MEYDNYLFEYFFIPKLISGNGDELFMDITYLDDFQSLKSSWFFFKDEPVDIDWEQFSIRKTMYNHYSYYLLSFPLPRKEPEALYGMIFVYNDKPPIYITLESTSKPDAYFLCEISPEKRTNYGLKKMRASLEKFERMALEHIQQNDSTPRLNQQKL